MALGTAAHIAQLERQFEELRAQQEILVRTEKLRAQLLSTLKATAGVVRPRAAASEEHDAGAAAQGDEADQADLGSRPGDRETGGGRATQAAKAHLAKAA